jgi:putative membrane protein
MVKLIIRIVINAVAIWLAAQIVSGVTLTNDIVGILLVAIIFGLINGLIKPLVKLLSLPLLVLTLGLFTLVINALLLWLTAWISSYLTIDGFFPALWASIIISLVSWLLSMFLDDKD